MEVFSGVNCFELKGVHVTHNKLGEGSYATVHELKYMGLKCTGKKIHKELYVMNVTPSYTVQRFEEECHLLSRIRHPNIVQFLGVFFQQGDHIPILVMEFLPTNLTSCIEQYGILPKEISYSILHDVALGLCYLHSQIPPIIHRDLSSNNVLLTTNMTAKISDLGMARIINLSPLQVSRMTQTPGTPHFMPPEVMIANPQYDSTIDIFSYGIMMIHMFSGRWPEPQNGQTRIEAGKLIPVTEAERREVFLRAIGNDHTLMDLILRCINNDPQARPHASEAIDQLEVFVSKYSSSFTHALAMLRQDDGSVNEAFVKQNVTLSNQPPYHTDQHLREEQLQVLLKDLQTKVQVMQMEKKALEADRDAAKCEVSSLSKQVHQLDDTLNSTIHKFEENFAQERDSYKKKALDQLKQKLQEEKRAHEEALKQEREKYQQLAKEHEDALAIEREKTEEKEKLCDELEQDYSLLKAQSVASEAKIKTLESSNSTLEEKLLAISSTTSIKDSEIETKTRALSEKSATIAEMNSLLSRAREQLATKQQGLRASIVWKKCTELPIPMCNGRTEIIHGKVYFRGMTLTDDEDDDDNILLCYDVSHDRWEVLPPLPVKWFGLGHIEGKLVAVGGLKKDDKVTSNVYSLNIVQKWKPTFPQMPTARCLPAVVTLQMALVVAGGLTKGEKELDAVEIFNFGLSQWYRTNPLPRPCSELSLVATSDACYALGGYQYPFRLNQALYATVDDLLRNAVPAHHRTTHTDKNDTLSSAWKILPDTPTYRPAAGILAGSLLAIGGGEASISEADRRGVYMFSPSKNSWIYVGDLPAPRSRTTVAMLSSTEILVIGGIEYGERVSSVYKGTLQIDN